MKYRARIWTDSQIGALATFDLEAATWPDAWAAVRAWLDSRGEVLTDPGLVTNVEQVHELRGGDGRLVTVTRLGY